MCEHHHEHHHHSEDKNLMRIFLSILILLIAIFYEFSGVTRLFLFIAAYLTAGYEVLLTAIKNIVGGEIFDENFLMSIATLGAIAIGEYPEAVMVMILYQIGEYFQDIAVTKSRKSIKDLMDIKPEYANIEYDGKLIQKSPHDINIDEIIIVKAGEKIPLDGVITEGTAVVDCSALTGESVPKELQEGDNAISGCINTNGLIKIKVTKKYSDSTVSKILELVEHAGSKKAKTEKFITKFAKYYTPIVVITAVLLGFIPPLLTGTSFNIWIERALTFLVISCPCALVISVPLGFFAGIGAASKQGILIKGSNYLEALANPYTVAFDKTGTLTEGTFKVSKFIPVNGHSENELLEATALAEAYSNHPIALSIKNAYNKKIEYNSITNVKEFAGNGVQAEINGNNILVGNKKLMDKFNIECKGTAEDGTIIYTAKNNEFMGYIIITDNIKQDSYQAIKELKKIVKNVVMLTGDSVNSAKSIGTKLGITEIYAQLLPGDKVEKIEEIILSKPNGKSVIFTGDGINDAPVLTRADIGVSMGALGSDAAIEAADIVIMDDNPSKIIIAINIAKRTLKIVKQNIIFAIGIKVLFLILGAFGLMSMWGAVFADVGVTLLAVLNSLRALK